MESSSFWDRFSALMRRITDISEQIDVSGAAARLKDGIWFRGANVWILACSIIIASVGLNINSTAVIIGAMLISPLMGPIIGMGMSLGTNDMDLLKKAIENFIIMVVISLLASSIYFLITPLELVNPTELEARTSPTIYDVIIALFGGLAGILESSRKERGTVISGVAIATALIPPLCTAGYGLANFNWHYFFGALYLFIINTVFITLATYVMVIYLHFPKVQYENKVRSRRTKRVTYILLAAIITPSIISAISLVRDNNFERQLQSFVSDNRTYSSAYLYDYKIVPGKHKKAEIYFAGENFTDSQLQELMESAERHGLRADQLEIKEHAFGSAQYAETQNLIKGIYDRSDMEIARKDELIKELEDRLTSAKADEIPYTQIAKELRFQYPDLVDIAITRGASVTADSLKVSQRTDILATTKKVLGKSELQELTEWMKVRLGDSAVVVRNIIGQ